MKIDIIEKKLTLTMYGYSGIAVNEDYTAIALRLMNQMWQTVKAKELKNKGINIWVYEPNEKVFAGIELDNFYNDTGLEDKTVHFPKYAYYKHIGPYHLLKQRGQNLRTELKIKGYEPIFPYVEMYGHWTNDEKKLETELLICLK